MRNFIWFSFTVVAAGAEAEAEAATTNYTLMIVWHPATEKSGCLRSATKLM